MFALHRAHLAGHLRNLFIKKRSTMAQPKILIDPGNQAGDVLSTFSGKGEWRFASFRLKLVRPCHKFTQFILPKRIWMSSDAFSCVSVISPRSTNSFASPNSLIKCMHGKLCIISSGAIHILRVLVIKAL